MGNADVCVFLASALMHVGDHREAAPIIA